MTFEESRFGPRGYIVCALADPNPDKLNEWTREHYTRYHGWPTIVEDATPAELDNAHWEQHKEHEKGDGNIAIPHKHLDFVPDVIASSSYARSLKDALYGVIELARGNDDQLIYAPDSSR